MRDISFFTSFAFPHPALTSSSWGRSTEAGVANTPPFSKIHFSVDVEIGILLRRVTNQVARGGPWPVVLAR